VRRVPCELSTIVVLPRRSSSEICPAAETIIHSLTSRSTRPSTEIPGVVCCCLGIAVLSSSVCPHGILGVNLLTGTEFFSATEKRLHCIIY